MQEKFAAQMKQECEHFGIELTERQLEQFYKYYELLIHWNTKINLTAITELEEVITKHFVDSLSLIRALPNLADREYSLIDVGTGAGFPGIPLKIAFPQLNVTLLDSLNKRVKFLNEAAAQLKLENISAVHGRAEDFGREDVSRETFDLCVSRAVANLSTLSEYCMPLVKIGGYFIPYKSGKLEDELEQGKTAVKLLGGEIEEKISFQLPNGDERILVKITKNKKTSKKYPRKAGIPSKEPLHNN